MQYPLVSIITVNFNQAKVTEELILSLDGVEYPNLEIIVVDNGSKTNELNALVDKYPHVRFIFNKENLGFAGGNNLGINEASGDYLLFLNNDTEVNPTFLSPLLNAFENKKVGMASPKIKYFNTNTIQYAGNGAINPYTGRSVRIGFQVEDEGQHDIEGTTEIVHGAAMMIPKRIIDEVGVMPELYFLYYEEVDWCEAVKNAGYEIRYIPQSEVYHKESMSVGKKSTLKSYYMMRSRLIYLRRNTKGLKKLSWILFYSLITFPINALRYLSRFEFDHLSVYIKSIIWNFKNSVKNPMRPDTEHAMFGVK